MSRLSELIAELCLDGVEYAEVGKLADISTGRSDRKDAVEGGFYPFYVRSQEVLRKNDYEYDEEAILIPGEGGIGQVFHYVNGKYALHQRVYRIHVTSNRVLTMFMKRYMESEFFRFITREAVTATVKSIRKPMIQKFRIPVPPLPVQEEIVRILDSFSSLEAELEAELEARRKQYAHYRDELFKFERERERVKYKTLGELCTNLDSKRKPVTKSSREPGPYPYYGASGIVDYVSGYLFDGEFLLVTEDGANPVARSTPIAFVATGKTWVNNHAHVLEFSDKTMQAYVEMYLNSIDLTEFITGAVQPKLSQKNLNRIPIPVPVGKDMTVMVERLKLIQELANDLSSGLPAEIEARHKQYEYYRDRLLTFPEKEV